VRVEALVGVVIIALLLATGHMGYKDEVRAEEHYQDMVCAKAWPPTSIHTLADCPELGPARPGQY